MYQIRILYIYDQAGRTNNEDSQAGFAEKKGNRMLCSAMPRPAQTMVRSSSRILSSMKAKWAFQNVVSRRKAFSRLNTMWEKYILVKAIGKISAQLYALYM